MEIKALKCQSCGSASLDFSEWRAAKCKNCSTVHIIVGEELSAQALNKIGATEDDISISIPLVIAVGLFLREQGLLVNTYVGDSDSFDSISDWRKNLREQNTGIINAVDTLKIYREFEIVKSSTKDSFLGKKTKNWTAQGLKHVCDIMLIGKPTMTVYGHESMQESERVIKLVRQGIGVRITASLCHS